MIVLYSTNCPKCKVLELKLKQLNKQFTVITDQDTVVKVGESHGIQSAPILQVGDNYMDFTTAVNYLRERK